MRSPDQEAESEGDSQRRVGPAGPADGELVKNDSQEAATTENFHLGPRGAAGTGDPIGSSRLRC